MQFIICRTTNDDCPFLPSLEPEIKRDYPPHKNAELQMVTVTESKFVSSDNGPIIMGAPWYAEGSNNRVEGDFILRDFHHKVWTIELKTLGDLKAFIDEVDEEIVVSKYGSRFGSNQYVLEIYDGIRGE